MYPVHSTQNTTVIYNPLIWFTAILKTKQSLIEGEAPKTSVFNYAHTSCFARLQASVCTVQRL